MAELLSIIYDISIHVPRERDDDIYCLSSHVVAISIHVPRERDDRPVLTHACVCTYNFNPRPS